MRDRQDSGEWDTRRSRGRRGPVESILAGSAFTLVFGALFLFQRAEWWWLFPMVFAGVLPIVEGIRRLVSGRKDAASSSAEKETDAERRILQAAHDKNGTLTAAVAALATGLPIKSAQEMLERLVKEGHAVMNVTNSGVIEFQFPEFLPPMESRLEGEIKRLGQ
jgi:hypothetical protein